MFVQVAQEVSQATHQRPLTSSTPKYATGHLWMHVLANAYRPDKAVQAEQVVSLLHTEQLTKQGAQIGFEILTALGQVEYGQAWVQLEPLRKYELAQRWHMVGFEQAVHSVGQPWQE